MFKKPPYQKINHVYFAGKTLRLWFTLFTPPRYGRQSNAQRRGRGMLKPRIDRRITQLVGLQTELDDTKSCYQLIKTMTKFEMETWSDETSIMRFHKQLTPRYAGQQRVTLTPAVHLYRHDVLIVPLVLKPGW